MTINNRLISVNFSPGRFGSVVTTIVLHTEDGYEDGSASWFNNPASSVSAHYGVALNGTIDRFVSEGDAAWHAGNWEVNKSSIGIETEDDHNPQHIVRPDAQYASLGQLVADICRRYGLPINRDTIKAHNEIYPYRHPNCPGDLKVDKVVELAQAYHDATTAAVVSGATYHQVFSVADIDETVTILMQNLQVRMGPGTNFAGNQANTPDGLVHAGDQIHVIGYTVGEDVYYSESQHTDIWLKTLNGAGESHYIWAGGTTFVLPTVEVHQASPAPEPVVTSYPPADGTVVTPPVEEAPVVETSIEVPTAPVVENTTPESVQVEVNKVRVIEIDPGNADKPTATINRGGATVVDLSTLEPLANVPIGTTKPIFGVATVNGDAYLVTQKMHDEGSNHGILSSFFERPVDSISVKPTVPVSTDAPPHLESGFHRWIVRLLHFFN